MQNPPKNIIICNLQEMITNTHQMYPQIVGGIYEVRLLFNLNSLLMKHNLLILALLAVAFCGLDDEHVTHKVTMSVDIGGVPAGNIILNMFGKVVPLTVENFVKICEGNTVVKGRKLTFVGSPFHRIIPGFMNQGGDITSGDGSGGQSIWGKPFADENFNLNHETFCISMANAGPNTNESQFFITTAPTDWLNGHYVVFGKTASGFEVVKAIEAVGSSSGKPSKKVLVTGCSVKTII